MTKLIYGLASLPFFSVVALAQPGMQSNDNSALAPQPMVLSEKQMDGVTAGWKMLETDVSNTSWTRISVYQTGTADNTITCGSCYLLINNSALSVGSKFGPTPP
jgi:hypothetical protein